MTKALMVLFYMWVGCMVTTLEATAVTVAPIEFQYTKDEDKLMSKWKDKTANDLFHDALHGDPAAMHLLGLQFLYGLGGMPINIAYANNDFTQAASLGFAPALDKIRAMYLEEDKTNIFLAMIYTNLVIAFGHSEYIFAYHSLRSQLVQKFGEPIANEIERIAVMKQQKIFDNRKALENAEDKLCVTTELLGGKDICLEDPFYDSTYWQKFVQIPSEDSQYKE